MAKKIQIRIFPDGKINAETKGIKGKNCTDYLKIIEELLQAKIVSSDYTEEYYQKDEQVVEKQNETILPNKNQIS